MRLLPPITDPVEFAEWRRGGIGASDIAAILGLSPWQSPWALWAQKTELVEGVEQTDAMEHGIWAEGAIVPWYEKNSGLFVNQIQHRAIGDEPWMRCTLDGLVWEALGAPETEDTAPLAVLECKATGDSPKKWAEEGIPLHYQCQATWQCIVTGLSTVVMPVLHVPFGRIKFEVYEHTPDDDDKATVLGAARAFWDCVLSGIAPDVDGTTATSDAINAAYGHIADADDTLVADGPLAVDVEYLRHWRTAVKEAEREVATTENRIKERMRDCAALVDPAGVPLVTWKPSTSHRVDLHALRADHPDLCDKYETATTTRRFLLKTIKGE